MADITVRMVDPIPVDGTRKVTALLLAMGKPMADRVLKYFSEPELKRVVESTAQLGTIPREKIEGFAAEMVEALERGADLRAGSDEIERMLAGVVSEKQLSALMVSLKGEPKRSVWPQLVEVSEASFLAFLQKEHPQIAAFIISKVGPALAANLLKLMSAPLRAELVRRILASQSCSEVIQSIAEESMSTALFGKAIAEVGPKVHSRIADIMNKMDRQQADDLLVDLDQRRPQDAKLLRARLFSFEDIARLSHGDRIKLFDTISADRTILALRGASPALCDLVLAAVSARSRRVIEQEMSTTANVAPRDVVGAQRSIADLALELIEKGQITIEQQPEA